MLRSGIKIDNYIYNADGMYKLELWLMLAGFALQALTATRNN